MATNSGNNRNTYLEMIKDHRSLIERIQKDEQDTLAAIKDGHAEPELLRLRLAEEMLNQASAYIDIDAASQAVLNMKNYDILKEARKSLGKSLNYLESVVTGIVDAPFSAYEKEIDKIAAFSPSSRYSLVQKLVSINNRLKDAYGNDVNRKWAMVEFEERSAVVAKNIINLRDLTANSDLRSPNYESTIHHLRLVKQLLMDAADHYRKKYEVYSNNIDDFKMATNLLISLIRFNILTKDQENAAVVKKKLLAWKNKLNADIKNNTAKKGRGIG